MVTHTENAAAVRARIEQETGPLPAPTLAYWLCGTPRTGSNLLRRTLQKANCGHPAEGYHIYANREYGWDFDEKDFIRYNRQMIEQQTTPESGIFGLKIFWEQFQYYLNRCDAPSISQGYALSPYEKIAVFFPEVKFIFLRRRNKLRQAISLVKAKQSNIYLTDDTADSSQKKPPRLRYNSRMIGYHLGLLTAQDLLWERFFEHAELSPHVIWYEDLAEDYKDTVRLAYEFLGVETRRVGKTKYQKLADEVSEEWYRQYLAENPWLTDPKDAVTVLANSQLRLLRPADGEAAVSAAIWWRRFVQLVSRPGAYLKRLRM